MYISEFAEVVEQSAHENDIESFKIECDGTYFTAVFVGREMNFQTSFYVCDALNQDAIDEIRELARYAEEFNRLKTTTI